MLVIGVAPALDAADVAISVAVVPAVVIGGVVIVVEARMLLLFAACCYLLIVKSAVVHHAADLQIVDLFYIIAALAQLFSFVTDTDVYATQKLLICSLLQC